MKTRHRETSSRGFALIVTLSLMILLTVIAVGLLSLSAISLRSTGQSESIAIAKSNARLALMLAIGDLQKAAGPDQRITASANLVDPGASPGITGVWESWKPGDSGSQDYDSRKSTLQKADEVADGEFVTWLASRNPATPADPKKSPAAASASAANITLVSERTDGSQLVRGTYLSPLRVKANGEMAWSVMDEGSKARIDLPTEGTLASASEKQARLRAPGRPQAEVISSKLSPLRMDAETAAKVVSFNQAEIQLGGNDDTRPFIHDLTPYSASLPVNVADGGLKADLTRAFEETSLPGDLEDRHVYSNTKTALAAADPYFSTLADYYRLYKSTVDPLQLSVPKGYTPLDRRQNVNLGALDGTLVSPVISRVSVVFSLISRPAHSHWVNTIPNKSGDSQRNRMVYLIYTPVVTAYNPYSVPIQFRDLKVTFRNLPVAFRFFRNGQPQNNNPALLNTFHILSQNNPSWDDEFSCTVSNTGGSSSGSLITLYPGEARVFGTCQPANASWDAMANYLWTGSLDSSKTKNVYAGAGWDYRSGYLVDWLAPTGAGQAPDNKNLGVFGVRYSDRINVEVTPMMPGAAKGKFSVNFQAKVKSGNRLKDTPLGAYEYNYGDNAKLTEILEKGNHTTIGKVSYPFKRERDLSVSEITPANPSGTITSWGSSPKQFAIFTLGTRTATDSLYPGKPGRTSSFVHHLLQMDATKTHPAQLPMEMSLLPITGSGANTVGSIDADDVNRAFFFSGTTRGSGAIHYVSQNLPSAPLVNLADLRHANLASSGHLPLVQSTVGESLASPSVPGDKARDSGTFGYEVLDHAWYANQTLWDGYYFSGIRTLSDANLLFNGGQAPLNPRLTPLVTPGTSADTAAGKAVASTSWSDLAGMLAIKGGFNVNSTSKNAWKAVLSSLREQDFSTYGPVKVTDPSVDPKTYKEVSITSENAAFPRLSRPIGERVDASNSGDNQRRWSGFRELDEQEVDKLAQAIVEEVRARGPFLSMAEFVNRRLASSSDDMSARGALEEAIRKSEINDIPMGPTNRVISEQEAQDIGFANPKAAAGNTEEGASAVLSQGDLLSVIGASVSVRSDTFVVRAYGAARDGNVVKAKAWCEAVIQRVPAYVDPTDSAEKVQAASLDAGRKVGDLSAINRRFGRGFEIISFRWLAESEV